MPRAFYVSRVCFIKIRMQVIKRACHLYSVRDIGLKTARAHPCHRPDSAEWKELNFSRKCQSREEEEEEPFGPSSTFCGNETKGIFKHKVLFALFAQLLLKYETCAGKKINIAQLFPFIYMFLLHM